MKKYLTIIAVAFGLIGLVSCQKAPSSVAVKAEAQDSKAAAPQPPTAGPEAAAPECDEACQQGRQNLAIQGKLELFTGALAVVGVFQVGLMFWQGWLLHLTRKTIDLQTKAAASSASSFINKERSRLFISHEITPDFVVTIRATNRGLSPARVTYKYVSSEFYKPTEEFRPEVPRDVEIGEPPENHICNEWVLPGKATTVGECDDSFISRSENPDLYKEIMDGEMIVWYFGIIRWIDSVTEDEQWIRFCYRCYPFRGGNYLSEGGPTAYRGSSDDKAKNPN